MLVLTISDIDVLSNVRTSSVVEIVLRILFIDILCISRKKGMMISNLTKAVHGVAIS